MALIDGESQRVTEGSDTPPLKSSDRPYLVGGLVILILAFGGFGGWSATAPLDSAAVAPGQVVVESYRKTVQHLEGGIVDEIRVEDGDFVDKGDLLLRLDDTQARSELDIVRSRLLAALAREARLKAERDEADAVVFPDGLRDLADPADVQEVIDGQRQVFEARRDALQSELSVRDRRWEQLGEQISGLQALMASKKKRIASYQAEMDEWQSLLDRQMTDKQRLREVKRRVEELKGEISNHQAEIARLRVQQEEAKMERILRKQEFQEKVVAKLRETQSEILDARARINALEDKVRRTDVVAPVSGEIVGLKVHTEGGVVAPGDPIMDIVPQGQGLIVEARVKPTDIDRVHQGLSADIRFSAFSSQTTHVIEGKVLTVSADALTDKQNETSYYLARVQVTEAGARRMKQDGITLQPGMPAEVLIKTGNRTLLEYIVKPFSNMFARSFRES